MARVDVPLTQVTRAGVANASEVTGDTTNGHSFNNDGRVWLEARNSAGTATRNVTLHLATTVDGQTVADRTIPVPINSTKKVGPFPTDTYGATVTFDVDNAELRLATYHL